MMNSRLASTMQTQRTTVTSRLAKRSRRSRNFTCRPSMQGAAEPPPPSHCAPARSLEVLLAVENEGDRLLHVEPLRLLIHQSGYRFHERRLVRRDDLGEVALERLQVLHFGDLPRPAHVGLG